MLKEQRASYDVYGNIAQLITDGSTQSTPTDASTNRLQGPFASYDAGGNVTSLHFGSESYEYTYDATNMMKYLQSNTDLSRVFLYNADDERIATFECPSGVCDTRGALETWTLRGFDNQVLRIYEHPWNEGWQWKEDYILHAGKPFAAARPGGQGPELLHLHLDHLGTQRQATGSAGLQVSSSDYHPFGSLANSPPRADLELGFTSHELDGDRDSELGLLYYMHARFCGPGIGRFLSPDRVLGERAIPQSWNRYLYGINNPVRYVDPDGDDFSDFVGGFFNALASDMILGAGRREPPNDDFAAGQTSGDVAAFAVGAVEAAAGGTAVAGSVACTAGTGGLCLPVAVAPAAAGAVGVVHGASTIVVASQNLADNVSQMSRQSGGSGGKREGRGRGANRRDRKQVSDAARQAGIEDRRAFGDFIEEVKHENQRGPQDNFTYQELLDLAEQFLEMTGGKSPE